MRIVSARIFLSLLAGKLEAFKQMLPWKNLRKKIDNTFLLKNLLKIVLEMKFFKLAELFSTENKCKCDSSLPITLKLKIFLPSLFSTSN